MTKSTLLPVRHTNRDFFVCDVFDGVPSFKDDQASMEHPIFSLSTKPDMRVLHYEHNGNSLTIKPSYDGLATIHDKDILLYCASYLRAAINSGHEPSQTIRFTAYDLLVSTNRTTNNLGYNRLSHAFNRLRGTTLITNIQTGNVQIEKGFGLIESWEIVKETPTGRMIAVEVKLSDWLYNAILSNELLTINRDYFRLRRPLERRLYELARKHCGEQKEWKIGLEKLHKKVGSNAPIRRFRLNIRQVVESNHLPDYSIQMAEDLITFTNRNWKAGKAELTNNPALPPLHPQTIERARKIAPGVDPYQQEAEWREWSRSKEPPRNAQSAFLGFLRKKLGLK